MPSYAYICEDGHITDVTLSMQSEKPDVVTCLEELDSSRLCAKPAKRSYTFAGFKI